ncbi:MAG: hypothetical protein ACM3ZO_03675 [Clostridia bacterium]
MSVRRAFGPLSVNPSLKRWKSAHAVMKSDLAEHTAGNQSLDETLANIERLVPPAPAGTQ